MEDFGFLVTLPCSHGFLPRANITCTFSKKKKKCLLTILLSSDCGEEFERMSTRGSELGWLSAGVHPGGQ